MIAVALFNFCCYIKREGFHIKREVDNLKFSFKMRVLDHIKREVDNSFKGYGYPQLKLGVYLGFYVEPPAVKVPAKNTHLQTLP